MLARALLAHPDLLVVDDVAGVLDDDARRARARACSTSYRALAVVEATVDTPLLTDVTQRIELAP